MEWRILKPKSYQIRWLASDAANALLAAGIPVDPSDDGIFIQAEDLGRVLSTLNAQVVASFPSQFKRIDEVVLSHKYERHDQGTVSIEYAANREQSPEAENILSVVAGELLPTVKRDIVVHLAAGQACAPVRDGRFHIFVDSAAAACGEAKIPEEVFGIEIQFKRTWFSSTVPVAYKSTGSGGPIVDWNTAFTAAELVDNCLYIHFDLLSCRPIQMQRALLARILKRTVDQLRADELLVEVLRTIAPEREAGAPVLPIRFDKTPRHFARQTLTLIGSLLSPQVTKPIVVHMEAAVRNAFNDAEFHVFLPGSPSKTNTIDLPLQVFDVAVTSRSKAWSLATGATPVTDEFGFVVAQLVGMNNLFIAFNPLNDTLDGIGNIRIDWELLGRILRASMKELDVDSIVREIVGEEGGPITAVAATTAELRLQTEMQGFIDRPLAVVNALSSQLLAPAVGMDVVVVDGRGENHKPLSDGRFHVIFQATPLGEACTSTPAELFGVTLPTREPAFWPSGAGIAIADDAGFLVGELVENTLYIHAKLIHHGTRSEAKMLARLMVAALREFALRASNGRREGLRGTYQLHCLSRVNTRLVNSVENPVDPEAVRQTEVSLHDAIALMRRSERDLLRLEVSEQFGKEYDDLLAIEKVRNVTVGNGQIVVDTHTLFCVDDRTNRTHEIGAFKIHIPTEGGRLKWFNQTRTLAYSNRTMNAPHVGADGHACEGTTKDEWPHFIAQRQFAYVVMKAIQFVESANTGDVWGKGINQWPMAAQR